MGWVYNSWLYSTYATVIFLSSFLLFQVQPLISKHILPWYGGSAAVWITAMMFFMSVLLLGYVYALIFTWLPRTTAVLMHIFLQMTLIILLVGRMTEWPSPITPDLTQGMVTEYPLLAVIGVLTTSVGLPFLILASSSTILQYWYQMLSNREPFSLYAVSNIGSLLGLLSYPLVFERLYETQMQGWWWAGGILLYITLSSIMLLHWWLVVGRRSENISLKNKQENSPSKRNFVRWMMYTAIPVMTMMISTSYISSYVATIPFLWIIPLALYLISFIISFRFGGTTSFFSNIVTTFGLMAVTLFLLITKVVMMPLQVFFIFLTMFSVFHLYHERLYLSRPSPKWLAWFYVAISLGGVVASICTLLFQFYIFTLPIELFALYLFLIGYTSFHIIKDRKVFIYLNSTILVNIVGFIVMMTMILVIFHSYTLYKNTIAMDRNFFGYKAISESTLHSNDSVWRFLTHGLTNHGFQIYGPLATDLPLGYYAPTSGIAIAFDVIRGRRSEEGIRVAVGGLGAGTLAAYCNPNDSFVFFEIDPQVIDMAKQYFTYLDQCSSSQVIAQDARLGITEFTDERSFDLIILDAYADDMIPIHLLTKEAISLYKSRLVPDGILAIHITSRYLSLEEVVSGVATANNLVAYFHNDISYDEYTLPSKWTILTSVEIEGLDKIVVDKPIIWTDRYSTLLPIVRWSVKN
jgi:16S rRNA G966 N2-methylase RsmD